MVGQMPFPYYTLYFFWGGVFRESYFSFSDGVNPFSMFISAAVVARGL